ncbi:glutathione S-transferase [Zopfia rhizophila CBS 207.26]|uniref:Glutathione S-transferase n=1 Tax=Zopfia rhizophila CBS 207.26 TaxID=1314779 RepID=A0A6A6DDF7_9PEZI|nr:glutathione S-transferase [Zopfia rhizophila CBS 207.26]
MGDSGIGKLTIYVDCVSPYSWFRFTNITKFRPLFNAHGVQVEILPFFLGGARDSVGNPWTPNTAMTGELLGLKIAPPEVFPISSLFPVRVVTWAKDHYPVDKFEQTFLALVSAYWSKGINVSTPEGVFGALDGIYASQEIKEIMKKATTPENKKRVVDIIMNAGAFGAPWIVVVNRHGEKKYWFGIDRWDQVLYHLGVPYSRRYSVTYRPVSIIPPEEAKAKL